MGLASDRNCLFFSNRILFFKEEKPMKNRFVAWLLCLVMLLSVSAVAAAEDPPPVGPSPADFLSVCFRLFRQQ